MSAYREQWQPGEAAWFEYHCDESDSSVDVVLRDRSHQRVVVVGEEPSDAWEGSSFRERGEAGQPKAYGVRFGDGFLGTAVEDELSDDRSVWYRPDPAKSQRNSE